jgi:hypothetical protein
MQAKDRMYLELMSLPEENGRNTESFYKNSQKILGEIEKIACRPFRILKR